MARTCWALERPAVAEREGDVEGDDVAGRKNTVNEYLESAGVEHPWVAEEFWVVMYVPEQRHHFPSLRYKESCTPRPCLLDSDQSTELCTRTFYCDFIVPLYSTSATASLKGNEMMLAILRLSSMTYTTLEGSVTHFHRFCEGEMFALHTVRTLWVSTMLLVWLHVKGRAPNWLLSWMTICSACRTTMVRSGRIDGYIGGTLDASHVVL